MRVWRVEVTREGQEGLEMAAFHVIGESHIEAVTRAETTLEAMAQAMGLQWSSYHVAME